MKIIKISDTAQKNTSVTQLSSQAMIMYALLQLRFAEARKNNLCDENGEVFCYYTIREFQKTMKLSEQQIVRCKRELCRAGLMREVHVLGLASRLYVRDAI